MHLFMNNISRKLLMKVKALQVFLEIPKLNLKVLRLVNMLNNIQYQHLF